MKFVRIYLTLIVLLTLFIHAEAQEENDVAVARVGVITIYQKEYSQELEKLLPMAGGYHGGIKPEKLEKVKEKALQNLIDRAYKFQFALKEEIALDSQEFDAAWLDYKKKIQKRGLTEEELAAHRAAFYQEMLAKKAEEVAVDSKVVVTDEQVKSHFKKNREMFKQPKQYTASHIFIKVDPSEPIEVKAKKREKAQELYEKAVSGEDFYNLAYYNSDDRSRYVGGSLGRFKAGQTVREFDRALSKMKVGDISKPIQTIYGFHIIRLDAVEEARLLTYDEVASLMRKQYREMERDKVYKAWMKQLQELFPLEVYTEN